MERGRPALFIDKKTGKSKTIVDERGKILNFPGVRDAGNIEKFLDSPNALNPYVQFGGSFETRGEEYLMYWIVQPDGRYWEVDDGFGGTSDPEVILCAFMDKKGNFKSLFRLYRIGKERYDIAG